MNKKVFRISVVVAVFLLAGGSTLAGALRAGAGKAEIVLEEGMPLSGYGNRIYKPHSGVHDSTFSRALILESEGKRVGLVNADILMLSQELRDDLAQRVADLELDLLAVTATHTHYGIGAYVDNTVAELAVMGKYDVRAYEIVVGSMESSLRMAAAGMVPARAGSAEVESPGVTVNRRHQGGPTDPGFRVLAVWGEDGSLLAAVMNHAIHPTTMPSSTSLVSGDCTGAAERKLEERYPGSVAMFMNAGLGDQSPCRDFDVTAGAGWDLVDRIGERMADAASTALDGMSPTGEVDLSLYRRTFEMPEIHLRRSFECWGGLNQLFKVFGKDMMREKGVLMGVGIDDALLLFSPGELTVGVQAAIQDDYPGKTVFVVVHANDIYGYVVTPEDYDTGGYETCMNFYGREFATLLEREFRAMVAGSR